MSTFYLSGQQNAYDVNEEYRKTRYSLCENFN